MTSRLHPLRVDADHARKIATLRVPPHLAGYHKDDVDRFIDQMIAARLEWEGQGYAIEYREAD